MRSDLQGDRRHAATPSRGTCTRVALRFNDTRAVDSGSAKPQATAGTMYPWSAPQRAYANPQAESATGLIATPHTPP